MEIPEGWNELLLQDITAKTISYGIVQAGPHVDDGIPYIKSSDLTPQINLDELQRTSHAIHKKYVRSSVVAGDIVFSLRGDIGAVAIVPTTIKVANLTQGTARIAANESVDTNFLYQLFKSNILKKAVLRVCKGSTFQEISLKDLRKIKVTLPDTVEQNRIAEILGTWDQAITVTEALIAQSEAQKKALMQQLLTGKRRLPGFEGKWREMKLGDMFDILTSPSKTKKIDDNGTKLIVDMGAIDRSSQLVAHKKIVARTHPLNEGDLVMPKDDIGGGQIIGRVAYIPDSFTYELGDHVYGLRHRTDEAVPLFSYYRINEFEVLKSLRRKANGTAQLGLGKKDVLKQIVSFPSQSEQRAISLILKGADKKIQGLQAKLQTLKTEKVALMQQLLTGKRRVKLTEAAA